MVIEGSKLSLHCGFEGCFSEAFRMLRSGYPVALEYGHLCVVVVEMGRTRYTVKEVPVRSRMLGPYERSRYVYM